MIGCKEFLLVLALEFSLCTWKIKKDGEDNSKYTAASIYILNVSSAVVSNFSLITGYVNGRPARLGLTQFVANTQSHVCAKGKEVEKTHSGVSWAALYRDSNGDNNLVSAAVKRSHYRGCKRD